MTSRRQAVATLSFQVEQLLKVSSSQLSGADQLEAVMDEVRHKLNIVSTAWHLCIPHCDLFTSSGYYTK